MNQQPTDRMNNLFNRAAGNVETERKSKFKNLPGDPVKGTLYKGFVSSVEINQVEGTRSENYGRELLVIRTQVTEAGEFKGWEETFNRVLYPVSIQEPTEDGWRRRVEKIKTAEPNLDDQAARVRAEADWEDASLNHYKHTLKQLEFIGVDTSSKDFKRILALAAHASGNPAAWKVYDATETKTRRAYLEDASRYFSQRVDNAPNLFEELPNGNDIPLD